MLSEVAPLSPKKTRSCLSQEIKRGVPAPPVKGGEEQGFTLGNSGMRMRTEDTFQKNLLSVGDKSRKGRTGSKAISHQRAECARPGSQGCLGTPTPPVIPKADSWGTGAADRDGPGRRRAAAVALRSPAPAGPPSSPARSEDEAPPLARRPSPAP